MDFSFLLGVTKTVRTDPSVVGIVAAALVHVPDHAQSLRVHLQAVLPAVGTRGRKAHSKVREWGGYKGDGRRKKKTEQDDWKRRETTKTALYYFLWKLRDVGQ